MRILGNIIWLIFGGLEAFIGYVAGGLALCVTIVGIPFGLQVFKLAEVTLWPFNKTWETKDWASRLSVNHHEHHLADRGGFLDCVDPPSFWTSPYHYNRRDPLGEAAFQTDVPGHHSFWPSGNQQIGRTLSAPFLLGSVKVPDGEMVIILLRPTEKEAGG